MRKSAKLLFWILVIMSSASCKHNDTMEIKGAWKWVSIKYMSGDTVKWIKTSVSTDESGIKMWSDDYFLCVYRFRNDTTYDYSYSGGTYVLDGKKYEETVIYHDQIVIPEQVGLKEMMLLEMRGDTLVQTYPVDEKGKTIKHFTVIEKFIKLDSASLK